MVKKQHLTILVPVLVLIITLFVHWPALSSQVISFDDDQYVMLNNGVQNPGWSSVGRFLTEVLNPSTVKGYYQPLTMISLMLDNAMGASPQYLTFYHMTSLLLHMLNTGLLVLLLYRLFRNLWIAAAVGLLFGIHPMSVEVVTWIAERKTLLATFFALLSLNSYLLYANFPGNSNQKKNSHAKYYWLSLLLYLLSLMSKPTTIPLPVLMLLIDYWPLLRLRRKTIMEKVPFLILSVIFSVITYLSQKYSGTVFSTFVYHKTNILLIFVYEISFYLHKLVLPIHLSSSYPIPDPFSLSNPALQISVVECCLLILLLTISIRWTRACVTGFLFFLIAIFPTMGLIGFTSALTNDKYAYFPVIGLLLSLTWAINQIWSRMIQKNPGISAKILLILVILVFSILEIYGTRGYLINWKNSETFLTYMLRINPKSDQINMQMGNIMSDQGKLDEATMYYRVAIHENPIFATPYNNLANVFIKQGKVNDAITDYNKAIQLDPNNSLPYYNLGNVFYDQGELDKAFSYYQRAVSLRPESAGANNNLGELLLKQHQWDAAILYFQHAIAIQPKFVLAYNNRGIALFQMGKVKEALDNWRETERLQPNLSLVHFYMGRAFFMQKRYNEAIQELNEEIQFHPENQKYTQQTIDAAIAANKKEQHP